jgi:serine/threonine-protein kinase HipA
LDGSDNFPYSAEDQRREAIIRAGRFILKPQHAVFPLLPESEDVTTKMAAVAGIEVFQHGLLYCQDQTLTCFIKRFDRPIRGKNNWRPAILPSWQARI